MLQEALDRRRRVAGAVVADLQAQLGPRVDDQLQGVVGAVEGPHPVHFQGGGPGVPCTPLRAHLLLPGALHGVVLHHHDALEEGPPAREVAPALHLHQGTVLVLAALHLGGLQGPQPGDDALSRRKGHPHGEGVDEDPHHLLHPGEGGGAPGDGGPEDDAGGTGVPLGTMRQPAVATKEEGPGPLHDGAQGDLVALRQGLQGLRGGGGEAALRFAPRGLDTRRSRRQGPRGCPSRVRGRRRGGAWGPRSRPGCAASRPPWRPRPGPPARRRTPGRGAARGAVGPARRDPGAGPGRPRRPRRAGAASTSRPGGGGACSRRTGRSAGRGGSGPGAAGGAGGGRSPGPGRRRGTLQGAPLAPLLAAPASRGAPRGGLPCGGRPARGPATPPRRSPCAG